MSESSKMSKTDIIKWSVVIALGLICFLIPSTGWYADGIKNFVIITVVCLAIAAMELLPVAQIGLMLPVLYLVCKVAPVTVIMSPWSGGITMLMIIGGFLLAAIMEGSGVLTRLAYFLMAKVKGSYAKLLVAIYLVSVILSILMFGGGSYMIMGPLCVGLCMALGAMRTKMGAGIAFACMLGTCSSHSFMYTATSYAIIKGAAAGLVDHVQFDLISILIHNLPTIFMMLLILFITVKWYKPDQEMGDTDYFKAKLAELGPMKPLEIRAGIVLALVFLFMFTSKFHGYPMEYGLFAIPLLAWLPGFNAADASTFKRVNWDMIFFGAGCISIGTVATHLGLGNILAEYCIGFFEGGSITKVFFTIFVVIFGLNFVMTPTAIWALISAPILTLTAQIGIEPLPVMYFLVSMSEAIILPYEYLPYLIVYAFGMMSMKDFIKLNAMRCVLFVLGIMFLLIPWWQIVGIL